MINSKKYSDINLSKWFWLFYILVTSVGVVFRLYLITDQVLLDDEWHALKFANNHSLWYLLTHFSYAGGNIIPINAYVRILLISLGWSEFLLVLPSLVSGIACLVIFPLVIKHFFSTRVTLFFSFLFAFSPLIIFYSRVARPYSIYTLLGFLCIWLLFKWALTGKKRFCLMFAVAGILCIYFHFVGVIFIFVPLGCTIIAKLLPKFQRLLTIQERIVPGFSELISVGCGILICLAILLTPAIIQMLQTTNSSPARFSLQSISGFLQILSGTSHIFLNIIFYTLLGIGLIRLYRKSFLIGFIFVSVFAAYVFVSFITRSNFAHVPLVLARYVIPAFPMAYILVALGMDSMWKKASILALNKKITNAVFYGSAVCFLAGLFWTGPLRQTYAAPNNFTNHSTFQESYSLLTWDTPRTSHMIEKPYVVNKGNMSIFYKTLANQPNVKKIIEYPMLLGNHFNLFYYYQRFHEKRVAVGYTRSIKDPLDAQTSGVLGDMIIDQVLSQVKDPGQLKFRNMVDILDMAAVKKSKADFVVFHKNTEIEILGPQPDHEMREIPLISTMTRVYLKLFGQPIFEDKYLVVFKVRD